MEIRDIRCSDLEEVVEIHCAQFPGFFLTKMGPSFLFNFYKTGLECDTVVAVLGVEGNQKVGFAIGFGEAEQFKYMLKKKAVRFVIPLVLRFAAKPTLIFLVIQRAIQFFFSNRQEVTSVSELSSLAAIENSSGYGSLILEGFLSRCRSRGFQYLELSTDNVSNDRVHEFYHRNGFRKIRLLDQGKREMAIFGKHL